MDAKMVETVAQAILQKITGMLIRGELRPGQKLPGEKELAARLDVSVSALKDALKVLNVLGVIESKKGEGMYVAQKASDSMLNPLVFGLLLEKGSRNDLFELRQVMEVGALGLAITKATDDDLQALADNLRKYEGRMNEGDYESLAQLDTLFHQLILEASKNPLYIRLGKTISQLFALPLSKALNAWGPEQILKNHTALYNAICAKDFPKAQELITAAFQRTKEFF